jgi:hypothetical protein
MTASLLPITAAEYHDETFSLLPHLSSSIAREIVLRSPLHAWSKHPKFGGKDARDKPSKAMSQGTLIHALVLDAGHGSVAVIEAKSYVTKKARAERARAVSEGKTPVLTHKLELAKITAELVQAAIVKEGFSLASGKAEQVITWEEETPHGPVPCRAMLDWLHDFQPLIIDLKTCTSAHPDRAAKSVEKFGYHIQQAAYRSALRKLRPGTTDIDFPWVFCEILSPSAIILKVYRPAVSMIQLGERLWHRACERWAECLQSNVWPDYEDREFLEADDWAHFESGLRESEKEDDGPIPLDWEERQAEFLRYPRTAPILYDSTF